MESEKLEGMDAYKKMVEKVVVEGLKISRIPEKALLDFKSLANQDFSGDYGMTIKFLIDQYKMSSLIFENFNFKLEEILVILRNLPKEQNGQGQEKVRKNLAGQRIDVRRSVQK